MYIIHTTAHQIIVNSGLTTHVFELPKNELVYDKSTEPSRDNDSARVKIKMTLDNTREIYNIMEYLQKPFAQKVFMYKASSEANSEREFIVLTTNSSFYEFQKTMKESCVNLKSDPVEINSLMDINHPGDIYFYDGSMTVPVVFDAVLAPTPFY